MYMADLVIVWVEKSVKKKLLQKKANLGLKRINDVIAKYQETDKEINN